MTRNLFTKKNVDFYSNPFFIPNFQIMRVVFSPFLLIFFLGNAWAQDPDTLLASDIPQPPPPTSEYVLLSSDGGSSALQSGGAFLLAQANQQKPQKPNSLTDQTPAKFGNSWDSNELWDCVADKTNNGGAAPAASPASPQQQPKARRRRRARRWENEKRDQQPDTCPTGPTYIQPKINPYLIKNPALPVNPTKPERFGIPVFPGSNAVKGDNPTCLQKTLGWLPLGICDSGVASDRYESVFDVFGVAASLDGQATTGLDNCVLGASFFLSFQLQPQSPSQKKTRKKKS